MVIRRCPNASAYDGGDCCECTCENTLSYTCGDSVYACIDPSATCVDDDDVETFTYINPGYTTEFSCNTGWLSDGLCDLINNIEDCGTSISVTNNDHGILPLTPTVTHILLMYVSRVNIAPLLSPSKAV